MNHPHERLRFGQVGVHERLAAEYQVLGFASKHPFELLEHALPANRVTSAKLMELEHGAEIGVAGLVVARQRPQTAISS